MIIEEEKLFIDFMELKPSKKVWNDTRHFWHILPYKNDMLVYPEGEFQYDGSMDWLYPVYQKICQWFDSEEWMNVGLKDPYGEQELTSQFNICCERISDGEPILEVYTEIVNWIKIYNEKVKNEK